MAKFLAEFFSTLLKLIFPSIVKSLKHTNTEAVEEEKGLTKKLSKSITDTWGKSVLLICFSLFCVGCGTKTVYVPDGTPIKLRETLKDVKVWIKDKDGNTIASTMDIPEGWFALPKPKDDD